ncbi:hypothetical protein ACFQO9_04585 [Chryseobacterium zhengzhouense]|uniref:Uncharacterized protein n=1 Tax=Chryseobacterium zhengzhouense TaxID=1636086 RepID=A0ABW2LXL1_9FLAO
MIKILDDEEIERYCQWYLGSEAKSIGYGLEDYESTKERLIEFKNSYS